MNKSSLLVSHSDTVVNKADIRNPSLRFRFRRLIRLFLFLAFAGMGNIAFATITVTATSDKHAYSPSGSNAYDASTGTEITLRSAIEYANYHSGTTISVPPGTYSLSLGELQVGTSTPFTITINGTAAASTIVDQTDGTNRVINIDPSAVGGITCTLTNMTIENGQDKADNFGGGGIIDGSGSNGTSDQLTLTNCIIQNNSAYGSASLSYPPNGGGLDMGGGYLTVTNCTFSNNNAVTNGTGLQIGAGIYYQPASSSESLTISGSTFSGNTVNVGSSNAEGAGLAILSTISGGSYSITNTTFSNNSFTSSGHTGQGAAVESEGGETLTITGSIFTNNSALGTGASGGAIISHGNTDNISYCRFSGNTAPSGVSNLEVDFGGTATANKNWWASNSGPGSSASASGSGSSLTDGIYIKLTNMAARTTIVAGDTTKLTAGFLTNSDGSTNTASSLVALSGVGVTWGSATLGTLSNQQTTISNGTATATFTTTTGGSNGSAQSTVDGVTATTSPTITIDVGPNITTNPTNQTVNAGSSVSFTAAAGGMRPLRSSGRSAQMVARHGAMSQVQQAQHIRSQPPRQIMGKSIVQYSQTA